LYPKQHLAGLVRFPISKPTTYSRAKFLEIRPGSYFILDTYVKLLLYMTDLLDPALTPNEEESE
jgi:hypothetical protein